MGLYFDGRPASDYDIVRDEKTDTVMLKLKKQVNDRQNDTEEKPKPVSNELAVKKEVSNDTEEKTSSDKKSAKEIVKDGNLIRSYFKLPDLEKEVEKAFKKEAISWEDLFGDVLSCDRVRCDLPMYTMQMLTNPNKGSWDLWETEQPDHSGMTERKGKKSFYARDPRLDISKNGIIGIDFGTKSTVVTYLEDTNVIRPLRIGTGELDREVQAEHFENPTVMEFCDIDAFLKAYRAREGRPYTRWADVTSSHTAANNRKASDDSDDCAAFLGELKQWAGTDGRRIHIRDKKGHEETLPPYTTLQEGDFDPIEIYAYYIGLYLNNQHMGKIYMHYILSFPVTYAKAVQEHILDSFRRGLRKSLPLTVVRDEERMKKFRVEAGAGEPAAYAVCALQELEKKGVISASVEQPLFYGVFDFGGGTSDFDFGTWRKADKGNKKESQYNRIVQRFGAGGKPYLGGENLLKQLAYHVVEENAEELRKKQIPFVRAPECEPFPGDETIVNDSQEAETNMQRLMEKLRPFWERKDADAPEKLEEGSAANPSLTDDSTYSIKSLAFFDKSGEPADNVELTVNVKNLEKVLKEKLTEGIKAFFDQLVQVRGDYREKLDGRDVDVCHILLAGRSSLSPLFQQLFKREMLSYEKDYQDAGRGMESGNLPGPSKNKIYTLKSVKGGSENIKSRFFEVHSPLGGDPKDFRAPNGKTGVAFGLLLCRSGGKITVISEKNTTKDEIDEIAFRFFVGKEDEGRFQAVLKPGSTYGEWVEFQTAQEMDNDFYYTTSASAGRQGKRGLSIDAAGVHRGVCVIPKDAVDEEADAMIYWRATGPKAMEYVVADEKEIKAGTYRFGPEKITLEE